MTDDRTPEIPPDAPGPAAPTLSARQKNIINLLRDRRSKEGICDQVPLEVLYSAAHRVLEDSENPDRISQSACSVVELIDFMRRCIPETPIEGAEYESEYYKKLYQQYYDRLQAIEKRYKLEISDGSSIDSILLNKARAISFFNFLEAQLQPIAEQKRRTNRIVLTELVDQVIPQSPSIIEEKRISIVSNLKNLRIDFEKIKHHNHRPTPKEFERMLGNIDFLLSKILEPDMWLIDKPIAHLNRIDDIIARGEQVD